MSRLRHPLIVNPEVCHPLPPVSEMPEEERPRCVCGQAANWMAPPSPGEVVRQVEQGEHKLVALCALCVLYSSILFRGRYTKLRKFIQAVEREGGKPFRKSGTKVQDPEDAQRILGSLYATSVAFLQRDRALAETRARLMFATGAE